MLSDRLVLKNILKPILIPEIEIVVDDGVGFTVKVFEYIFFFARRPMLPYSCLLKNERHTCNI